MYVNKQQQQQEVDSTTNNIDAEASASAANAKMAEILPNRLYLCYHRLLITSDDAADKVIIYVDDLVHYDRFYSDFGPLNLAVLYRFCLLLHRNIKELDENKQIIVYSSTSDEMRVNTAYLIGAYCIIYMGLTAEIAYLRVSKAQSNGGFIGYRDAAMGPPTYLLHLHDVLRGVEKAVKYKWLSFDNFNCTEYEYYERVENGDLNWIIPNRILSFCGPHNKSIVENGYPYHAPEVYFNYFRKHNITTIVRLNRRMYDEKRFINAGFDHYDLFFMDGSTPSDYIIERFIHIVDNAKGAIAVHCKAGLGRTGTLIALWIMKEYGITAAESMAWIRICRPGSIIGPQQQFIIDKQSWCWTFNNKFNIINTNTNNNRNKIGTSHLSRLTSKVNMIRIDDSKKEATNNTHSKAAAAAVISSSRGVAVNDEKLVNEIGQTQGDRLLAMKVKAQNHYTTANTNTNLNKIKSIKMNHHSNSKSKQLLNCTIQQQQQPLPISRVTVSSTCTKPSNVVKSKCSKKHISGVRAKPYPATIKISMPASRYDLRSRHSSQFIINANCNSNPAAAVAAAPSLPPHSEALIGKRHTITTRCSS